jgi:hypothetical protein
LHPERCAVSITIAATVVARGRRYAARSFAGFVLGIARSRISSATDTASTSAGFVVRMKFVRTETKRDGQSM